MKHLDHNWTRIIRASGVVYQCDDFFGFQIVKRLNEDFYHVNFYAKPWGRRATLQDAKDAVERA